MANTVLIVSEHSSYRYAGSSVAQSNLIKALNIVTDGCHHHLLGESFLYRIFSRINKVGKYLLQISLFSEYLRLKTTINSNDYKEIIFIYPSSFTLKVMILVLLGMTTKNCSVWYHNSYSLNRRYQKVYSLWEKWLIEKSYRVYFLSEGLQSAYVNNQMLNKRASILHHVFKKPEKNNSHSTTTKKKLGISGNIDDSCRQALERLISETRQFNSHSLIYIGKKNKVFRQIERKLDFVCEHIDFQNDSEFIDAMNNIDIHVVLLSSFGRFTKIEYETIFPTRLIQIISTGRPFVTIAPQNSFLCKEITNLTNQIVFTETSIIDEKCLDKVLNNPVECDDLWIKYSAENLIQGWLD